MRVLIQVQGAADLATAARAEDTAAVSATIGAIDPGLEADQSFAPVAVPALVRESTRSADATAGAFATGDEDVSIVMRGQIGDEPEAFAALSSRAGVRGVYADPDIETQLVCPGDPAVGDVGDVEGLLDVAGLHDQGMDGSGVLVAICDTGFSTSHLQSKGRDPSLDAANSFQPTGVSTAPGQQVAGVDDPRAHGTMCAYDVGIAAPAATLADHSILLSQAGGPTAMSGLLSDALRSYARLQSALFAGTIDRLVINNSWGMYNPGWDFPVGHPGNYSDNLLHPFNLIVGSLTAAGADVLFAAGNCGRDCPDGRCGFATTPIAGANSHPSVLSVAGVDTTRTRVGYSSQGPGRLSPAKPDLSGYTHFLGSEAFGPGSTDGGTSTACPVTAGVIAAVRSRFGPEELTPAELRSLVNKTCTDLGGVGYDADHGWGVLDPAALRAALPAPGPRVAPPWPGRYLKYPPLTSGTDARTWQRQMVNRGFEIAVDGHYGPKSREACLDLQGKQGLETDGIVGPNTWAATWA